MRHLFSKVVLVVTGVAGGIMLAAAQAPAQKPSFEVASIKVNASGDQRVALFTQPGGRIVATNVTLKNLMAVAYRVRQFEIVGGPKWIDTDRWDIEAKAEEGSLPSPAERPDPTVVPPIMLMTQSLIEDRFQLKMHRGSKELPVYELFVAKGGLKIKLSEDQGPIRPPERGSPPPTPPQQGGPIPRGFQMMGIGKIEANAVPLRNFIAGLSQQLGRTVIDKTGLTGLYDITLQWTPDQGQGPLAAGAADTPLPADTSGPSIFTAIQEQLGLRLESSKSPIEVLVIDSVQKPSEN